LLIFPKLRLQCLVETNRLGGDHMHEGTALDAGENHGVDLFPIFFLTHDDSPTWTPTAFVCRARHKMRVGTVDSPPVPCQAWFHWPVFRECRNQSARFSPIRRSE